MLTSSACFSSSRAVVARCRRHGCGRCWAWWTPAALASPRTEQRAALAAGRVMIVLSHWQASPLTETGVCRLPMPRPGQVLGLVGTNGIGKSTAIKVLAGKLKPNLGRFTVSSSAGLCCACRACEPAERQSIHQEPHPHPHSKHGRGKTTAINMLAGKLKPNLSRFTVSPSAGLPCACSACEPAGCSVPPQYVLSEHCWSCLQTTPRARTSCCVNVCKHCVQSMLLLASC